MAHVSEKSVVSSKSARKSRPSETVRIAWGNVPVKPAQRKQLLSGLRRCISIGKHVRGFVLSIDLQHVGKFFTLKATVNDSRGSAECKIKETHWHAGLRQLLRSLHALVHTRRIEMLRVA